MEVHSISLKGHRDQNEDKHSIILNINNKNPNYKNINFFGVYDGHGGKPVSDYLEANLAKFFLNKKMPYPLTPKYVNAVYNHMIKNLKKTKIADSCGSTCLVLVHYKENSKHFINILNTGDSRAVLCKDNFALQLTKDHKPNWPEERIRITNLGGKIIYDGNDWRIKDLSVSRAVGDFSASPFVTHTPEIFNYELDLKKDKFIVLACDGLWDVLTNFDVCNFILLNCYDQSFKKRINKQINIAKKLAEYAINKGSTDNVTIIVVFLS